MVKVKLALLFMQLVSDLDGQCYLFHMGKLFQYNNLHII